LVHGGGTYIAEPALVSALAETLLLANQLEAVFGVVDEGLRVTRHGHLRHVESELHRFEGEAARAVGDARRARAAYVEAIEGARSIGARFLEARSTLALKEAGV
jgi:hypothetical protein